MARRLGRTTGDRSYGESLTRRWTMLERGSAAIHFTVHTPAQLRTHFHDANDDSGGDRIGIQQSEQCHITILIYVVWSDLLLFERRSMSVT
jgi:hypothetical protein